MFNRGINELKRLDTENIFNLPPGFKPSTKPIHIIVPTHHYLDMIKIAIECLKNITASRSDVHVIILDSGSDDQIRKYLSELDPQNFEIHYSENYGKARLTNNYCHRVYQQTTIPELLISMDPDIIINSHDFDSYIEAFRDLKGIGVLGVRYEKNLCNPERNLIFKPRRLRGKTGKEYLVNKPFMCNVAGPFIGIPGSLLKSDLNYRYFPVKRYAKYCPDEGPLHDALKWRHLNGYLEGTCVTHLKSGNIICTPTSS